MSCLIAGLAAVAVWGQENSHAEEISRILLALGRRGFAVDAHLRELNRLIGMENQPFEVERILIDVRFAVRKDLMLLRPPASRPDEALISRIATAKPRILAVTAHPDDENMMSGLLAFAIDHGCAARILCLTRGEAGENPRAAIQAGEALGVRRTEELRAAAEVLGVEQEILGFENGAFRKKYPARAFWFPDDAISAWSTKEDPATAVAKAVRHYRPDIVLTIESNWGWTGHCEHRAAAELVRRAVDGSAITLAYAVTGEAEFTDAFLTGARSEARGKTYWEVKVEAARRHASQYALPPGAENAKPETVKDLGIEHFRRVEGR